MQLIPEQNPFAFIPLCFCATQRRTEGTTENPLATPTSNWNFFDVLAISKDKQEVLVVELKKGRASDSVVGQIQRYMGYVAEEVADEHQRVRGVIVALEDDLRIKRALKVAPNIEFYQY